MPARRDGRKQGPRARGGGGWELSRDWVTELRGVSSPVRADRAIGLVAKALDRFEQGDHSRAVLLATEAKQQVPRSGRVRELLGIALYHSGDYKQAANELLAYRRLTGSLEQNHVIADCYRALGRPDRAQEICAEVSRKDVTAEVWAEVLIVAAGAAADKGEFDRALKHLARGETRPKRVAPHHLRLWYMQADVLEKAGLKEKAQQVWERIFAEDPDFFDVSERVTR